MAARGGSSDGIPAPFEVTPGESPEDGLVNVNVTMSYDVHRGYQVIVGTPRGPVTSRVFARYAETHSVVEELVRPFPEVGPRIRIQADISAPEPSWLSVGQPVLIRATPDREPAPGWVGAFFEGGVWVMGVGGRSDALLGPDELGDKTELTAEQLAQVRTALRREQDRRVIKVRMVYGTDRRYRLSLDGPHGPVTSEPLTRTADAGPTARRMLQAAFGSAPVISEITGGRPPWLSKGQAVGIREFIDKEEGEGWAESFGWVGDFYQGGVYVVDVGGLADSGIYPPEQLDDRRELTAEQLALIEESKRHLKQEAERRRAKHDPTA